MGIETKRERSSDRKRDQTIKNEIEKKRYRTIENKIKRENNAIEQYRAKQSKRTIETEQQKTIPSFEKTRSTRLNEKERDQVRSNEIG